VALIIASGIGAAIYGGFPILRTGWILWTLVLFLASGVIFMLRVAPLQRQMLALAQSAEVDHQAYRSLARRWELWGGAALATPLAGLVLMVLKPSL
jgi:uncharacterized membrane protein